MNYVIGAIILLGYLIGAILFGFLLVKSAESVTPSHITSMVASVIRKVTGDGHCQRKPSNWFKNSINCIIGFYASLEERIHNRIYQSKPVKERNNQDCARSPEGSLDFLSKDIPQKPHHIKRIISKAKEGSNHD